MALSTVHAAAAAAVPIVLCLGCRATVRRIKGDGVPCTLIMIVKRRGSASKLPHVSARQLRRGIKTFNRVIFPALV